MSYLYFNTQRDIKCQHCALVQYIFTQLVMGEKSVNEIGGQVVYKIVVAVLKNVSVMPDKIYPLLADLSGIPAEEIPEMPFGTTPNMIWDIVKDAKNAIRWSQCDVMMYNYMDSDDYSSLLYNASFFRELSKLL